MIICSLLDDGARMHWVTRQLKSHCQALAAVVLTLPFSLISHRALQEQTKKGCRLWGGRLPREAFSSCLSLEDLNMSSEPLQSLVSFSCELKSYPPWFLQEWINTCKVFSRISRVSYARRKVCYVCFSFSWVTVCCLLLLSWDMF